MFAQIDAPADAARGPAAALDTLQDIVARLASSLDELTGIGVAHNPGWRTVPLAATLAAKFGVPVAVETDARAAAWGEFRFGGHRARTLLAVFVGTGVGSGAVLDGALWTGSGDGAGDLGHTRVVPYGLACPCGGHGCRSSTRRTVDSSAGCGRRSRRAPRPRCTRRPPAR